MPYLRTLILALLVAACQTPPAPPAAEPDQAHAKIAPAPPTPQVAPPPAAVPAAETPERPPDDGNAIYFASASTQVDAAGEEKLRRHAAQLAENRKTIVTLTGLSDDQGSRSFNLLLAEQRVEAVAGVLRKLGVSRSQIRPYALGSKAAEKGCRSAACRAQMRRVELSYDAP